MFAVADNVDRPPSHHHRSQSSIQFSHSDKFFCKLLSKESDHHHAKSDCRNPSFRVYYGGSTGSVPFTWETTPGTPKHALFLDGGDRAVLPPLTPPPSFFSKGSGSDSVRSGSRRLLDGFIRRMRARNTRGVSHSTYLPPSPSCDSASSESSGGVDPKASRLLRNWRSLSAVRFSVRSVRPKATSFGGCFGSH
uniref:Uncharacterized protein n=1 Tax=Kalanchoe fedtschenkoi TaxID=63787 RepID=A0A7N0SVF3_KALFE